MRRSLQTASLVLVALYVLMATDALAHPASGIVVDAKGEVFFVHTGQGACKIDAQGKLTNIQKASGGHFLALDTQGTCSSATDNRLFKRITPSGVKPALLFASGGAPLV